MRWLMFQPTLERMAVGASRRGIDDDIHPMVLHLLRGRAGARFPPRPVQVLVYAAESLAWVSDPTAAAPVPAASQGLKALSSRAFVSKKTLDSDLAPPTTTGESIVHETGESNPPATVISEAL